VLDAAAEPAAPALRVEAAWVVRASLGQVSALVTDEAGGELVGLLPLLLGSARFDSVMNFNLGTTF
jgi:hypothetical protein